MSIDWDAALLGPVMAVFGEGQATDPSSWPTYYPAGRAAFQLADAVFDAQYQRVVALDDGGTAASTHPVLGVRAAIFVGQNVEPQQGDKVRIASVGKTFRVSNSEPDGHGHILLVLMETGQ